MEDYQNILIGPNTFSPNWKRALDKINKKNIIITSFDNLDNLKNIIVNKNITYILPLSNKDYSLIKNYSPNLNKNIKILYPTEEIFELLDNKNLFTEFMLKNYNDYIPDVYYLNNTQYKDITYPVIYKPTYSINGKDMTIIHNHSDFLKLKNYNIIQKFIEDEYEYGAYMLCIDGIVINWKIIRSKFKKYNIKKGNFPQNYENIDNFDVSIFKNIICKINYSGGLCINFKFDENTKKINIFEINPRFGGSAFTCNFIYELICIK
jgi:carbamoylphosphate synthase large subunit